jgi:hypothetical protein
MSKNSEGLMAATRCMMHRNLNATSIAKRKIKLFITCISNNLVHNEIASVIKLSICYLF